MNIAIISDVHDNAPNLQKALSWMVKHKVEQIIHCGDLSSPQIMLPIFAKNFKNHIHMVFGNVDDKDAANSMLYKYPNLKHYGSCGDLVLDNKKVAFVHFPEKAKELASTQKYDFVFYGHTHQPWEEVIGQTKLINPGTLAGLLQKATFATWDTVDDTLELKILQLL